MKPFVASCWPNRCTFTALSRASFQPSQWAYVCRAVEVTFTWPDSSTVHTLTVDAMPGRLKEGLYEPALADSEREAVADLLGYLENVRASPCASTGQASRPRSQMLTSTTSVEKQISSPESHFNPLAPWYTRKMWICNGVPALHLRR